MSRGPRLDYAKVAELHDQGLSGVEIAKTLGVTKGAVSKALRKLGLEVVKCAVKEAKQHYEQKNDILGGLSYLFSDLLGKYKAANEGQQPRTAEQLAAWLGPELGISGEVRKIASTVADIYWKIYGVEQVTEFMRIVEEELLHESEELQKRVRDRFNNRLALRVISLPN